MEDTSSRRLIGPFTRLPCLAVGGCCSVPRPDLNRHSPFSLTPPFIIAITWLTVACGGSIHPPTTPPSGPPSTPPPSSTPPLAPTYTVACVVTDADTQHPVEGAECVSGFQKVLTNGDGYGAMQLGSCRDAKDAPEHCGWLQVNASGYVSFMDRFENSQNQDRHMALTPDAPTLPRLHAQGQHFVTSVGRFTAIEASGFTLYQQYLDGRDITPVLGQLRDLGFNMVRVFGMYWNDPANGGIGFFSPDDYGDHYFSSLPAFYKLLARFGLYGELTAFADATVVMPDKGAQVAHWNRLVDALRPITGALVEAVNENDQRVNTLAAIQDLPRPQDMFASHGSNGSQAWPVQPYWDYVTFHTNGAPEEQRKVGHNAMEIWNGPSLTNETSRDRLPQPFDSATGCVLLAAGCDYHTTRGKYGQPLDGPALDAAAAFVTGAKSVPLDCQDGPYIHRADLETPDILRAYQRGNDSRCIVKIRR